MTIKNKKLYFFFITGTLYYLYYQYHTKSKLINQIKSSSKLKLQDNSKTKVSYKIKKL